MLIERLAIALASLALAVQADASPPEWITPSDKGEHHYDIRWPGGTLDAFTREIDEAVEEITVLPTSGAERLHVPAIDLVGVEITEIMNFPRQVFSNAVTVERYPAPIFATDTDPIMQGETIRYTYIIQKQAFERYMDNEVERRFDIEFSGGPLKSYARAVHKAAGEKKIVVMEAVEDLPVPAIELTNVTIEDTARLLVNMLGVRLDFVEEIAVVAPSVVTEQRDGQTGKTDLGKHWYVSHAWSVEEIIGPYISEDDLLSAIDTSIRLIGGRSTVGYHPPTRMVMVYGPEAELELIDNVIDDVGETKLVREQRSDLDQKIRAAESIVAQKQADLESAREQFKLQEQLVLEKEEGIEQREGQATQMIHDKRLMIRDRNRFKIAEIQLQEAIETLEALKDQREVFK